MHLIRSHTHFVIFNYFYLVDVFFKNKKYIFNVFELIFLIFNVFKKNQKPKNMFLMHFDH